MAEFDTLSPDAIELAPQTANYTYVKFGIKDFFPVKDHMHSIQMFHELIHKTHKKVWIMTMNHMLRVNSFESHFRSNLSCT
jgi:glycosidase